jgi:hypothetical protein
LYAHMNNETILKIWSRDKDHLNKSNCCALTPYETLAESHPPHGLQFFSQRSD